MITTTVAMKTATCRRNQPAANPLRFFSERLTDDGPEVANHGAPTFRVILGAVILRLCHIVDMCLTYPVEVLEAVSPVPKVPLETAVGCWTVTVTGA